MRKPKKKKKPKPRIPIEAVFKLKTYITTTKKGKRGYNRKKSKGENRLAKETVRENL